jgi:hypothetical protein
MLSGIGDADILKNVGIDIKMLLPELERICRIMFGQVPLTYAIFQRPMM